MEVARTTLNLDPSVLRQLRRHARREGKSMGELASELLARGLAETEVVAPPPLRWRSADLGRPMVDLEDAEALRAVMAEASERHTNHGTAVTTSQ